MSDHVVITGIGMMTPLGSDPETVLHLIQSGARAAATPSGFDGHAFACPVCATIPDFNVQPFVAEPKTARLMNRDAQLAVAAARLALRDANVSVGRDYPGEDIGLFGATGLAGLPLNDVAPLIRASSSSDGLFELTRFGSAGLKAVSPILSFKILGNMPICFVAINEGIRGPNAIFTPWEGQGAQAIECAVRALRNRQARCALAGGCDVKTHELSFLSLDQQGVFDSWRKTGRGVLPGEGSVFLVLELEANARERGARVYARVTNLGIQTHWKASDWGSTYGDLLQKVTSGRKRFRTIIASANGDDAQERYEETGFNNQGIESERVLRPKQQAGDLFAAAAALQVALAGLITNRWGGPTLATCFGHGSEQAAFVLEEA